MPLFTRFGVPVIFPEEDKLSPSGSVPSDIAHVIGVSPVAVNPSKRDSYAVPAIARGILSVLIVGGVTAEITSTGNDFEVEPI